MGKNLFNEKTIKRLVDSKRNPTPKQKKLADEWIKLIEEGELKVEKHGYTPFQIKILNELLGYSLEIKEFKHEQDFVDFVISRNGKPILKIEAKGTLTKDLGKKQNRENPESPMDQLKRYMSDDGTPYGIVTNYQRFILFQHEAGYNKYYEFDFLSIKNDKEKLKEFLAIFSKEGIDNGFVVELRKESEVQDKQITNDLYKIYHETRLMLLKEFEESGIEKNEALHNAQLFLNRLMFVFFAEDISLIKKRILEEFIFYALDSRLSENSENVCNLIKNLFEDLDKGSKENNIFGFNGGLFKQEISRDISFKDWKDTKFFIDCKQNYKFKEENLKISPDERALYNKNKCKLNPIVKNILLMGSYKFNTEVKVEVLGHIFEQSLTDLEELKEEGVSKRKKDGVFYTPEYITDYICRNTIVPYLSNKGKSDVVDLIKEYKDNIEELEDKLKKIKILDPACGSGAFLIKAIDILLEIFKGIQDVKDLEGEYSAKRGLKAKSNIQGQSTLMRWNEKDEIRKIIENNIFGVDINEESVEITKLSLFLKIVRGNKKLPILSNNIKQGNSLIDDKEVAGDLAFDWNDKENGFGEIMERGGFDVVVGNPPYVRVQNLDYNDIDFFKNKYSFSHKRIDISILFFELALKVLSINGICSFITSNQFLSAEYGRNIRKGLLKYQIKKMLDFQDLPLFEDALTYTSIFVIGKDKPKKIDYYKFNKIDSSILQTLPKKSNNVYSYTKINFENLSDDPWMLISKEENNLLSKLNKFPKLTEFASVKYGIKSGYDTCFIVKILSQKGNIVKIINGNGEKHEIEKDLLIPLLKGKDVKRFLISWLGNNILYPYKEVNGKTKLISEKELKNKFPLTYNYLKSYKGHLQNRKDSRKNIIESGKTWFGLIRFGHISQITQNKILTPCVTNSNKFSIDTGSKYIYDGGGVYGIYSDKFSLTLLVALLNSKAVEYFMKQISPIKAGGYFQYSGDYLNKIPLPVKSDELKLNKLKEKAEKMLELNKEFYNKKNKFLVILKSDINLKKVSKKLEKWYEIDWNEFENELSKQKISLIGNKKDDWFDRFNRMKKEVLELKDDISKTDNEINEIVYNLYNITEEEKQIIESS